MGRPRIRHSAEHARMESWGEWAARIQAYASRSSTPEGRMKEEAGGATHGSLPGSRPVLPGWARLRTPAWILRIDRTVAEMPATLRAVTWALYVERVPAEDIRRATRMSPDEYREAVEAILVTVKWVDADAA